MRREIDKTGASPFDRLPTVHKERGAAAATGAGIGGVVGSVLGGPIGAGVGAALGAAVAVAIGEKVKTGAPRRG